MGVYGFQIAGGVNSTLKFASTITGAMGNGDKLSKALGLVKKVEKVAKGGGGAGGGGMNP